MLFWWHASVLELLKPQFYQLQFSIKVSIDIFSLRVDNIFQKFMKVLRCIAFSVLIGEKMLNFYVIERSPARPLKKTGSTSSLKVAIEISRFLHEFRVETSVIENFPSKSWGSGKYSNCYLYRFLSNVLLSMLRNNTLDFIHQDLNLKIYTDRVWFKKLVFNFVCKECPNSSKNEKVVLILFFFSILY